MGAEFFSWLLAQPSDRTVRSKLTSFVHYWGGHLLQLHIQYCSAAAPFIPQKTTWQYFSFLSPHFEQISLLTQ